MNINREALDAAYRHFRTNIVADSILNLMVMLLCIFIWKMTWYVTIAVFVGGMATGQALSFGVHYYLNTRKLKRGETL